MDWIVIPPRFTLSRHVEVLMAVKDTIYSIYTTKVQDSVNYIPLIQ